MSAGLSQEELAEKAGLSADAIAALERGRRRAPRPLTVRMLATALDLDDEQRAMFIEALHPPSSGHAAPTQGPPLQADALIGRGSELGEATDLLTHGRTRLLTLTGVGGVGKTRLAAALTDAVAPRLTGGVCWISLADRPNGSEAVEAIAAAVRRGPVSEAPTTQAMADHIGERELLLVLDNCEHVVSACAQLTAGLLQRCPQLRILATSRERLQVTGEVVRKLEPLAVPSSAAGTDEIHRAEAVQMFVARAEAHGVRPAAERLAQVSRICRQLDGIPLALELAAARVNVLTLTQIADELSSSFRILGGGNRTAHRRQRAIDAALDWSYDLLTPRERDVFEALSVFTGGWTLAAAESVCHQSDSDPDAGRVLDLVAQLIDKSLVVVDRTGPEARYAMYAVIRQYAEHRLDDSGRRADVERRQLDYAIELAETIEATLDGTGHAGVVTRLDAEIDNIRAALGRAISRDLADQALRLSSSLWWYFYLRGNTTEGRDWLESALQIDRAQAADEYVAKAFRALGHLAYAQCEYGDATASLERALELYRRAGDDAGAAVVLSHLGSIVRTLAEYDHAADLYRRSLVACLAVDDATGAAWARRHLGFVSWLRGDYETAHEHATTALEHFRDAGADDGIMWATLDLGSVALHTGDLTTAAQLLDQSLTQARRLGSRHGIAWSLNQLGVVSMRQEHLDEAVDLLDESLTGHQDLGNSWRAASVVEALAAVARRRGNAMYAAFLLSVAAALHTSTGAPVPWCERPDNDGTVHAVRAELDPHDFDEAWAAGQRSPLRALGDHEPTDVLGASVNPR